MSHNTVETKERKPFSQIGLTQEILNGLKNAGLLDASFLQAKTIPLVKEGKDIIAQVSPGSGKTCVFTIAGLEMVRVGNRKPQVIILSPTREIAKLTCAFANKIGEYLPAVVSQCFIQGIPVAEDTIHLLDCQIVTGTPDRIKLLIEEHHLDTSCITLFVLNEADRLYSEGFGDTTHWISERLPQQRQNLVFYTKQSEEVIQLINSIVKDPQYIACFDGTKIFYQITENTTLEEELNIKYIHLTRILKNLVSWPLCLIFSHLSEEQNLSLAANLKDLGWSTLVVPQIEDMNSSENISHRKIFLSSEIKSKNIQIIIVPHSLILELDSIKVIICLDPPEDTLAFLRRLNIDCVAIIFGTEIKLHPLIETCKLYDALALPLPNLVPDNHVSPPKSRTEYSGITVSPQDMNIYRDITRKAKIIKYLMETETWTHPRHQDISKKIILWQKEVRKSLLEKDPSSSSSNSTTSTSTSTSSSTSSHHHHHHRTTNTTYSRATPTPHSKPVRIVTPLSTGVGGGIIHSIPPAQQIISHHHQPPPLAETSGSTEQSNNNISKANNNNTETQVYSNHVNITTTGQKQNLVFRRRNQRHRSGNGELNPEKRYKFDGQTTYYQLFLEENKVIPPADPPAANPTTTLSNHQPPPSIIPPLISHHPPTNNNNNNNNETRSMSQLQSESTESIIIKPITTKLYQDVMDEDD